MGAHGGIGEALAQKLADEGADLLLTARNRDMINVTGSGKIEKHSLDVTDLGKVQDDIGAYCANNDIDGLAYCIGSIVLNTFSNADHEAYLESYNVNVTGAISALQAAEKSLKKANGSVVLFSTIAVQQGFANHTIISTAKGAIEGLSRALAAEWAPHVRVNCIAPSLTDTQLAKPITSSEAVAKSVAKMHPIPRLGTAADSAALAAFLLGDNSGWITGQVMHLDGGRSSLRVKG